MARKTTKQKFTYTDSCKKAYQLKKEGFTSSQIARRLMNEKMPTIRGGHAWDSRTASKAIERGTPAEPKADSRRTDEWVDLLSDDAGLKTTTVPSNDSIEAVIRDESEARSKITPIAAAPFKGLRKGLKRMTREGWEDLPDFVREAIVDRVIGE